MNRRAFFGLFAGLPAVVAAGAAVPKKTACQGGIRLLAVHEGPAPRDLTEFDFKMLDRSRQALEHLQRAVATLPRRA